MNEPKLYGGDTLEHLAAVRSGDAGELARDLVAALARIAELESERVSLIDASGYACECPPPGCDCAGCSLARDDFANDGPRASSVEQAREDEK
jgi:hypothetical protein